MKPFSIKHITNSLRYKIFLSMLGILVLSSLIIIIISVIQYKEEAKDYNIKRLERKERALKESVRLVLRRTTYPVTTENLPLIFNEEIHHIANVHNLNLEIYDLEGHLLTSSLLGFGKDTVMNIIPPKILDSLYKSPGKNIKIYEKGLNGEYISAYSFITDNKFKPLGILHIPYLSKSKFYETEMKEFLKRLSQVYLFLIIIAILASFYLSKYITKSHNIIGNQLKKTDISSNQKIELTRIPEELKPLVDAYNEMVDKLAESRKKLIQAERESAWKEMAKQVAHEIKNPLTPMRLSIEHFIATYDPSDPDNKEKLKEFADMLIEQIDIMDRIARTFSDFTKISDIKLQYDNLSDTVRKAVMLYNHVAECDCPGDFYTYFDKTRINQVMVNLIKNSIQAEADEIKIRMKDWGQFIKIEVEDNGSGIDDETVEHIFEPKFTTKSGGTGLGLAIVKRIIESHGGKIEVESQTGKGTKFSIFIPKKETL